MTYFQFPHMYSILVSFTQDHNIRCVVVLYLKLGSCGFAVRYLGFFYKMIVSFIQSQVTLCYSDDANSL